MKNILIFKSEKQWFFHVKADNGEIICQSEAYKSRLGARKGLKSLVDVIQENLHVIYR